MAIRVLHLIGSLRLGGAQVVVKQIVENASDEFEHFVYPLRAGRIDIPIEGDILRNGYRHYDLRKFFDILNVCKQHRIDVIHAHLHKSILGGLLATYFTKIPVIVHEHGPICRAGIQYSAYRLLLRLLKKRAGLFIAVSEATAGQLTHYAGVDRRRIQVVYNAVDRKRFSANASLRETIRGELNLPAAETVIGFAGRLSRVKGPDLLLEAFGLLREKVSGCTLVYVGDGGMKADLEAKAQALGIASSVRFLGFREDAAAVMNAFDIGCMPSRQEPFGLVALEIMSLQVPLVCTRSGGLAEFVSDGENALVPAANTPPAICDCLLRLIGDNALRLSLTEKATATARKFDVDQLVLKIESIYRDMAKKDID